MILNDKAEYIINRLNANGFEAFAVGGCVRDKLMNREVTDYDITTSALPNEVKAVFSCHTVIETGIKHGTVTVLVDNSPFEITTYRTEFSYTDSRHPDSVSFVSDLGTDLARRDFTVNSIAYSPQIGIIDPFGGISDIKSNLIRAVGDPYNRFSEDALRILRALRFSAVLGFNIERETSKAILSLAYTLPRVSPERIYSELKKLLCGVNAGEVAEKFLPVLAEILPINGDAKLLSKLPEDFPMRLTCLCGDSVIKAVEFLRADNATKNKCKLLSCSAPIPSDSKALKNYISSLGRENARYVAVFRRAMYNEDKECQTESILSSSQCLSIKELAVSGADIVALGIQGRAVGEILQALLEAVLNDELSNKKIPLLNKAKELIKNKIADK